jgi:PPK2 family polyphosphate:nucleotide phosphotransferase
MLEQYRVPPRSSVKLHEFSTRDTSTFANKEAALARLSADRRAIAELQSKLYAQRTQGLLVILQGIDASGKDSTVKHVLTGVNPSGVRVTSFKVPSAQELNHDYLWRYVKQLPERGMIGVFNRSHYEEVLVVRVHPNLLAGQHLEPQLKHDRIWSQRFREINNFEEYLTANGFAILKCFLHISREEQKKRFLARLDAPDKNWKFSEGDVRERALWNDYRHAFEEMLSHTSTEHAPWHIVPGDRKWAARAIVSGLIAAQLELMKPEFPQVDAAGMEALKRARKLLADQG